MDPLLVDLGRHTSALTNDVFSASMHRRDIDQNGGNSRAIFKTWKETIIGIRDHRVEICGLAVVHFVHRMLRIRIFKERTIPNNMRRVTDLPVAIVHISCMHVVLLLFSSMLTILQMCCY
jgi:CDP-diacylglycerol pyrophosphatase